MRNQIKGATLGALLNRLIDSAAGDGERTEVVERVARAGGVSASTLSQITRGEIVCPPLRRLTGFARALGVPLSRLRTAAERDGCSYDQATGMSSCPMSKRKDFAGFKIEV